jgi:hypothetical protein
MFDFVAVIYILRCFRAVVFVNAIIVRAILVGQQGSLVLKKRAGISNLSPLVFILA